MDPVVQFQPICVPTGRAVGFEAVAVRTDVPGDTLLQHALAHLRTWHGSGLDFGSVTVRLEAVLLSRPHVVGEVVAALRQHGVSPSSLTLAVAESVYLEPRAERYLSSLRGFRKAGISVAIDDFGPGRPSIGHLRQFPVDRITIAAELVAHLAEWPDHEGVVQSIVAQARHLGIDVAAAGVDTMTELESLERLGCDRMQGAVFAPPLPPEEAARWCRSLADSKFPARMTTRRRTSVHAAAEPTL